ncbi:MAG: type 4a pilus biogenesis protein PilO [Gammaproteobacteria bacterium]|nr:type 4a pilus biogenesis protein PilO [Gammaproteobacteria bacterium]
MSFADNFKNLDPNNPGMWPLPVQAIAGAVLCVGLIFGGWNFHIKNLVAEFQTVEKKEAELKTAFEEKQKKSANLNALKEQMKEMQQSFGDMLRQLPNKTEVAGLIVDISQTGLSAGLEFDLFQPSPEKTSEFYAELPISLKVTGNYHQFGQFVSGIAALPRIVTTHDVTINKAGKGADKGKGASAGGTLTMSATAKTYRALEEES